MMKQGSWWTTSKKDPRWNMSGRDVCGGFIMPAECRKSIEEKKKVLGEPPDDLEYEYMKD